MLTPESTTADHRWRLDPLGIVALRAAAKRSTGQGMARRGTRRSAASQASARAGPLSEGRGGKHARTSTERAAAAQHQTNRRCRRRCPRRPTRSITRKTHCSRSVSVMGRGICMSTCSIIRAYPRPAFLELYDEPRTDSPTSPAVPCIHQLGPTVAFSQWATSAGLPVACEGDTRRAGVLRSGSLRGDFVRGRLRPGAGGRHVVRRILGPGRGRR